MTSVDPLSLKRAHIGMAVPGKYVGTWFASAVLSICGVPHKKKQGIVWSLGLPEGLPGSDARHGLPTPAGLYCYCYHAVSGQTIDGLGRDHDDDPAYSVWGTAGRHSPERADWMPLRPHAGHVGKSLFASWICPCQTATTLTVQ